MPGCFDKERAASRVGSVPSDRVAVVAGSRPPFASPASPEDLPECSSARDFGLRQIRSNSSNDDLLQAVADDDGSLVVLSRHVGWQAEGDGGRFDGKLNVRLTRYSPDGAETWSHRFGDMIEPSIDVCPGGDVVLVGTAQGAAGFDPGLGFVEPGQGFIARFSSVGRPEWQQARLVPYSLVNLVACSEDYVAVRTFDSRQDVLIIELLTSYGATLWSRSLCGGPKVSGCPTIEAFEVGNDGSILAAGSSGVGGSSVDGVELGSEYFRNTPTLLKFARSGRLEWASRPEGSSGDISAIVISAAFSKAGDTLLLAHTSGAGSFRWSAESLSIAGDFVSGVKGDRILTEIGSDGEPAWAVTIPRGMNVFWGDGEIFVLSPEFYPGSSSWCRHTLIERFERSTGLSLEFDSLPDSCESWGQASLEAVLVAGPDRMHIAGQLSGDLRRCDPTLGTGHIEDWDIFFGTFRTRLTK
jgi:hypothetical protein